MHLPCRDVLNPGLYSTLEYLFGEVRVANRGMSSREGLVYIDPITKEYRESQKSGGEQYLCCCPFCNDRGFHLYISHLYGTSDLFGRVNKTAQCFHGCLQDPRNRASLYTRIVSGTGIVPRLPVKVSAKLKVTDIPPQVLNHVTSLRVLPTSHPVKKYLADRHFGEDVIDLYHLGVCEDTTDRLHCGRLVIPVYFNGKEVGWQTRKIDDSMPGPKYVNARGFAKSRFLYNFDVARQQPYVVLVEGVTDVWRVGRCGVCLFGKSMSQEQQRLLLQLGVRKPLIILLDPDASEESRKAYQILSVRHTGTVHCVTLPDNCDPASLDRASLFKLFSELLQTS